MDFIPGTQGNFIWKLASKIDSEKNDKTITLHQQIFKSLTELSIHS